MDDKKKSIAEEAKVVSSNKEEIVGFDDIRSALDKLEVKKASIEQEMKDRKEKEVSIRQVSGIVESDASSDREDGEKETSEKEENIKNHTDTKETVTDESDKEVSDKKTNITEIDTMEKEKKNEEKGCTDKDLRKAITQSKRLADAKAAKDAESINNNQTDKKPVKEKKAKKGIAIFFSILVACIAIVYIVGFVYFSNYFYPDVAINGTNVSNMNKETAKKTLDDFYKNYVLVLDTIDGKQITITGTDIKMNIQLYDEFDKCIREQQAALWFVNMMQHHDYTIAADVTWNQDILEQFFDDMKILDKKLMTAPKDAYIGIEDGKFTIVKEDLGTTVILDKFKTVVEDSLSGVIANVNLKDLGCYELPKVYDTDEALNAEFASMSEFVEGVITLQLDDLTLEPGMELYDAVLQKSDASYTISKTKVQAYVKDLAEQYDTMGKERTFSTAFKNNKQVKITGTAFGYEMDQEATANALYAALQTKKSAVVEVIFKTKGYTLQGENDIGDTYIEVNLSEQKVVGYKGGRKIVEGDCVSGCEASGNGTCIGLYAIQDKLSPTVLRGEKKEVTKTITKTNKKGKKVKVKKTTMEYEYESPVTFWLQFNGGYGLHDAAGWRSIYGGSIYYYSGSHGCVNLPYDVAEQLYKNFDIGDPVVVYFWDNENRK